MCCARVILLLGACAAVRVAPLRRRAVLAGALGFAAQPKAAGAAQPKLYGSRSGILYYDVSGATSAPAPRREGERVTIAFTVWRNGFAGNVLEAGSGSFTIGDNSANDAVDELVRDMGAGSVRRATVPASFRLDPDLPSAPTYLEIKLLGPRRIRIKDCGTNATSVVLRPWIAR